MTISPDHDKPSVYMPSAFDKDVSALEQPSRTFRHRILCHGTQTFQSIRYAHEKFHLYRPGDLPEDEILAKVDGIRKFIATPATLHSNGARKLKTGSVLRQGKLTRAQILKAPRLKCIARNGTGYDMIDKATCLEKGIMVTNNPGGNAIPVAEVIGIRFLITAITSRLLIHIALLNVTACSWFHP